MISRVLLLAAATAALSGVVSADQVTLSPTDDADVFMDVPDENRGANEHFQTGCIMNDYFRNVLIRFDLSPYAGAGVNSATMRLYVFYAYGDFPTDELRIARNDTDWDELTVTWNNKPGLAESAGIDAPSEYGWWEVDVTDWVQDIVDGVSPNLGFQIYQDDSDYAGFAMRSKEHSTETPELVLDYSPAGLPSMTFGSIKALFR